MVVTSDSESEEDRNELELSWDRKELMILDLEEKNMEDEDIDDVLSEPSLPLGKEINLLWFFFNQSIVKVFPSELHYVYFVKCSFECFVTSLCILNICWTRHLLLLGYHITNSSCDSHVTSLVLNSKVW